MAGDTSSPREKAPKKAGHPPGLKLGNWEDYKSGPKLFGAKTVRIRTDHRKSDQLVELLSTVAEMADATVL